MEAQAPAVSFAALPRRARTSPVLSFSRPWVPVFIRGEPLDTVVPFRAWRYSRQAGELSDLVAPPYDVIGPDLHARLYARSPHNVVRVDLGATHPGDDQQHNQYIRAAALLAGWKSSGVLERDSRPTVTFVEESFTGPDGRAGRRHGLLAALRLSQFGKGVVFPHEHTLTAPKEDRFRLMSATGMSLSPVFLLYDLPGDEITAAWQSALGTQPPTSTTTDEAGNSSSLWVTSDPGLLGIVTDRMATARFLVADGHHRYETALRYQSAQGFGGVQSMASPEEAPASDFCLAYIANMGDPALTIYPTHRLVSGLPDALVKDLPRRLAETFAVERLDGSAAGGSGVAVSRGELPQALIAAYLRAHPRGAFGLWGPSLDAVYGFRLVDPAAAHVDPQRTAAHQELDVVILQTLVLERHLGISATEMAAEQYVGFIKDAADALARLATGEAQLGFFMNPTGLEQVSKVAFGGERMPQKTTFFYPKLPTGLVFHDLTGRL
jgi:uncharacterized protein (DUF1015 family)